MRDKQFKKEISILPFDGSYKIQISINQSNDKSSFNDSIIKVIHELITLLDFKNDFEDENFSLEDKSKQIIESIGLMLKNHGVTYGKEDYLQIVKSLILFIDYNRGDLDGNK